MKTVNCRALERTKKKRWWSGGKSDQDNHLSGRQSNQTCDQNVVNARYVRDVDVIQVLVGDKGAKRITLLDLMLRTRLKQLVHVCIRGDNRCYKVCHRERGQIEVMFTYGVWKKERGITGNSRTIPFAAVRPPIIISLAQSSQPYWVYSSSYPKILRFTQ